MEPPLERRAVARLGSSLASGLPRLFLASAAILSLGRLQARNRLDEWVRDIAVALNCMFMGGDDMGNFEGLVRPTLSQKICLAQVRQAVLDVGKPPDDVSGQGALRERRAHSNYMGEPVSLALMEVGLVSLPPKGSTAASMELIFGEEAKNYAHRITSKILAEGEVMDRKRELGLNRPYADPALRSFPKVYAEFCRKLLDCGLVEFKTEYKEQVGAFTVWKKSGAQRLVIDARLANLHFGAPEKAHFWYFALLCARASEVGCQRIDRKEVKETAKVYPCLKVVPLPVGWTHALWLRQQAHEFVVNLNPKLDAKLRCVDKMPVPEMKDYIHTQYVDNFVALSQRPGRAKELAEEIGVSLNKHGLPTHEVEAGVGVKTLGWLFSGSHPMVSITPKRLWKMRLATQELLAIGRANGKTIEKLGGHFTFAGLLQRGFLSTFQATYVFIKKHYEEEVNLWPKVARELKWASSLLCLVKRGLSSAWSSRVHATDAPPWGRGVVATDRDLEEVKALGRRSDRWRFTADEEKQVMQTEMIAEADKLDTETLEIRDECQLGEVRGPDTTEVPLSFIGEAWGKVDGSPWERHGPIPILEGRCMVWLLQNLSRAQKNLNKKHWGLCDSMSVVSALAKGRSSAPAMNRVCRQCTAVEFRTGMHIHPRWLPSELNPADLPLRAQSISSFNLEEGLYKFRANRAQRRTTAIVGMEDIAALNRWGYGAFGERKTVVHPLEKEQALVEGKALAVRRKRAAERQALHGKNPGVAAMGPGEELPQSLGQDVDLGRGSEALYKLDHALANRINLMYFEGMDPADAATLVAATKYYRQDVTKQTPSSLADAVCDHQEHLGRVASCRYVVVDGVGYVWPTGTDPEDAQAGPGSSYSRVVTLNAFPTPELKRKAAEMDGETEANVKTTSKVNESDEAVLIDQPYMKGFGSLMKNFAHKVKPAEYLFTFDPQDAVKLWNKVLNKHGYVSMGINCTYQLRHGTAPQTDVLTNLRTLTELQKRGRRVSEKVLQRRQSVPGLRQPQRGPEGRGSGRRAMDVEDFRRWGQMKDQYTKIGPELFSGCGHFSRAARRRMKKIWCAEVDIIHGPQFDLTLPRFQRRVMDLLISGQVAYVWLGAPCNSQNQIPFRLVEHELKEFGHMRMRCGSFSPAQFDEQTLTGPEKKVPFVSAPVYMPRPPVARAPGSPQATLSRDRMEDFHERLKNAEAMNKQMKEQLEEEHSDEVVERFEPGEDDVVGSCIEEPAAKVPETPPKLQLPKSSAGSAHADRLSVPSQCWSILPTTMAGTGAASASNLPIPHLSCPVGSKVKASPSLPAPCQSMLVQEVKLRTFRIAQTSGALPEPE
eukprot:s3339_g3.t1